jgi:hypothetical protein
MVEKQWFVCHKVIGHLAGFWPNNDISQADLLTPAASTKPT